MRPAVSTVCKLGQLAWIITRRRHIRLVNQSSPRSVRLGGTSYNALSSIESPPLRKTPRSAAGTTSSLFQLIRFIHDLIPTRGPSAPCLQKCNVSANLTMKVDINPVRTRTFLTQNFHRLSAH